MAMATMPGCTVRGSKRSGPASNAAASVPLASTSQTRTRRPVARGVDGERGGDRGLADATLAGDEEQAVVDQVGRRAADRLGQPPKPMWRSPSARPTST